jgi:lipopolysaccharide biosynthesis glycosyltransferase
MNFNNKITAVTIGIGDPYFLYAQRACKEVEKFLNIETKIIDEKYLKYCVGSHHQESIWSLKFSIFDIFPDIDTVMYFDADWRPLKEFNILDYCSDSEQIYFATDCIESPFIQNLEIEYGLKPGTYVNAGWFVINKKYKTLLNYCRDNLCNINRSFYGDQCVINQILKDKITLVDKRLNNINLQEISEEETLGLHNKDLNWKFYNF